MLILERVEPFQKQGMYGVVREVGPICSFVCVNQNEGTARSASDDNGTRSIVYHFINEDLAITNLALLISLGLAC